MVEYAQAREIVYANSLKFSPLYIDTLIEVWPSSALYVAVVKTE